MPRPEARPPGPGDIRIPATPQRASTHRAPRRFAPRVVSMTVRRWMPHPVSVWQARALGDIYGRAIAGYRGTVSTGASRNGSGRVADPAVGFSGYAAPPQLFTGWNPAYLQHVGTPLRSGAGQAGAPPGSSALDSAMVQIMQGG